MNFSIITPSYNQAQFLIQTMTSVLEQKPDVNYQVIDGGSTDESTEIIEKHKNQLDYWGSEPDNGQSHAINKGLKRAKGDFINWLNSDDYYEANALATIEENLTPDLTGIGAKSRLFNSAGTLSYSRGTDIYLDNVAKTIGWARIDQPETFFCKEAWDKVGLLNESLHYCMDREWWIRYLYLFGLDSFKRIDDVLVNFRIHDNSKTQTAQPGFLKEHHSLYYAMAKVIDHQEAMRFLEKSVAIHPQLDTTISEWKDNELVRHSFNYYLLKSADEFYAQRDFKLVQGFLGLVTVDWLADEDKALYKRLKFRSQLGPLVKFLRP